MKVFKNKLLTYIIIFFLGAFLVLWGALKSHVLIFNKTLNRTILLKNYAIGIMEGENPFKFNDINIKNPVLSVANFKDTNILYVADPFIIKNNIFYMFFEVLKRNDMKGVIALATSEDCITWDYKKIILEEDFHLSYPYIFKYGNEYYLLPETKRDNSIRLYKSINFPFHLKFVKKLVIGSYCDPSIIFYKNKWWLFASKNNEDLYLFYADNLEGPYSNHKKNPVIKSNPHLARPAGRIIEYEGKLVRYAQNDFPDYGLLVYAFQILEITETDYKEKQLNPPVLYPSGKGWNAAGMHHISPLQVHEGKWIAAVDGWSHKNVVYKRSLLKTLSNFIRSYYLPSN